MLNYNAQGLIPAIIQDDDTDAVLMLGYMNAETLKMTREIGQAVFWSRSRQEIWHKGATSGDYLEVRSIKADCENNSLLVRVKMLGNAVCHTGATSMLNYNAQGLIPAIIQDDDTDAVLMLGYMNAETLKMTREIGQAVFWSRSRQEIWHKGATSGDYLEVRSIKADCENNSLLVRVKMLGNAVCHTGARSCFFNDVDAPAG